MTTQIASTARRRPESFSNERSRAGLGACRLTRAEARRKWVKSNATAGQVMTAYGGMVRGVVAAGPVWVEGRGLGGEGRGGRYL